MIARLRSRLSYANVASSLALFLALSTGTAYAANEWTGANIVDQSLTAADLKIGTIGTARIQDESLTSSDLGTDSVGATEIADGSIDSGEIVNDSLLASDLAAGSVGTSELAANSVDSSKVLNNSLTAADIAGADVNGSVSLSAVPNGRCSQVVMSIGGAKTGEVAVVAVKAAIQNGIVFLAARVPSDGHVTANICNFSGTTMTPITDLPVRVMTFG